VDGSYQPLINQNTDFDFQYNFIGMDTGQIISNHNTYNYVHSVNCLKSIAKNCDD